ncbi:cyclin-domain-containing protein, partial [Phycomyces nitens]
MYPQKSHYQPTEGLPGSHHLPRQQQNGMNPQYHLNPTILQPTPSLTTYAPPPAPLPPMAEPLPNATDLQPTTPLTLHELAEFSSTMVYLMWHTRRPSVMALHNQSKVLSGDTQPELTHDSNRETANIANEVSSAFRKFCRQILNATQLSESVIMLSLKYIAMLLQNNPLIQGAEGSEYRLFTVALMLANKFLDDNTFTNKTWAEVSGMKVTDLNIMELEFLDVLKFRLFVRKDEYERWKTALFGFRSQIQSFNQAEEHHRQKVIEATFKSMGLPMLQPDQPQWGQSQQEVAAAQHQQDEAVHQYHQRSLYLLSKEQQPQFPTQPLNRPLVRVPLRIPMQPIYRNHNLQTTSNISQQQQQQQSGQIQQAQQQQQQAAQQVAQ